MEDKRLRLTDSLSLVHRYRTIKLAELYVFFQNSLELWKALPNDFQINTLETTQTTTRLPVNTFAVITPVSMLLESHSRLFFFVPNHFFARTVLFRRPRHARFGSRRENYTEPRLTAHFLSLRTRDVRTRVRDCNVRRVEMRKNTRTYSNFVRAIKGSFCFSVVATRTPCILLFRDVLRFRRKRAIKLEFRLGRHG